MQKIDLEEQIRIKFQKEIDLLKLHSERNRLGQFATPKELALEMLTLAKTLIGSTTKIRFLDPAIGTGAFYSACLNVFDLSQISEAKGFEIDCDYANVANLLWNKYKLTLQVSSFFEAKPPTFEEQKYDLIICNPPYVRHQHITTEEKKLLNNIVLEATGIKLSGLAGLYCYFLLGCHSWMSKGAIAGWLIPSEFMDVNYGRKLKEYLLHNVTVLRIHRFDPSQMQFKDALVSSAIVWIKNERPSANSTIEFTQGGTLETPANSIKVPRTKLEEIAKWSKVLSGSKDDFEQTSQLKDYFRIKRGIATGANNFFILNEEALRKSNVPATFLKPILPAPRDLTTDVIEANSSGQPMIENRLLLLSCNLTEEKIKKDYPDFWAYLHQGIKENIKERYICKHRVPWYSQENRQPAPILFNIIGRATNKKRKPYRFILNKSSAIATNNYLMLYPKAELQELLNKKPDLIKTVWECLKDIPIDELLAKGRVYGGEMYKLEPNELGQVNAKKIENLLSEHIKTKQISEYLQ